MFGIFKGKDNVDVRPKECLACLELLHCQYTDMNACMGSLDRPIALRCLISSSSMTEDLDFISRIYHDERPISGTNSSEWNLNDFIQIPADATVHMMFLAGIDPSVSSASVQTAFLGNDTTQPILIDDIFFEVIAHRSICSTQLRKENIKLDEEAFDLSFIMDSSAHGHTHTDSSHGIIVRIRIKSLHATNPSKQPVLLNATHENRALCNAGNADVHTQPIGKVSIVIWKGKRIATLQPTYVTVALSETPDFRYKSIAIEGTYNPVYDFSSNFEISSLQSDIVISVHEAATRRVLGRVVVPVIWFLDKMKAADIMGASVKKKRHKYQNIQRSRAHIMTPGINAGAGADASASADKVQANLRNDHDYELKHWFELYPAPPVTRWNRGGQYRPITTGMNFSSGFGLATPPDPLGFLKVCVSLHLYEPLLLAMVRNPMQHSQPTFPDNSTEEDGGFQDMILAAHNMYCILLLLFQSPIYVSLNEVLHWKEVSTSAVYLYVFSYMTLLAPMWQWPLFITLQIIALGMHGNTQNTYNGWKLFSAEKDKFTPSLKDKNEGKDKDYQASVDPMRESDVSEVPEVPEVEGKESYAQQYRKFKSYAYKINKTTTETRSYFEKANNLFTWSDLVVSTMFWLVFIALSAGLMLMMIILTPRQILFLVGLFLFTPPDIQESVISIMMTVINGAIKFTMNKLKNKRTQIQKEKLRKKQMEQQGKRHASWHKASLDNRMLDLLQQFSADSIENDFSDDSSDASDKDSDSDNGSDEDDITEVNFAEPSIITDGNKNEEKLYNSYGIISAAVGSYTDQFCSAIYKILAMAPDESDVCHRVLCRRALVLEEDELTVLPNKCLTWDNRATRQEYNFIIDLLTAYWKIGSHILAPPLVKHSFALYTGNCIGDCPDVNIVSSKTPRGMSSSLLSADRYSESLCSSTGSSTRNINAINAFMVQRLPTAPLSGPLGFQQKKNYQIHVELISAKNLPFAYNYMPSLLTQKIYCDVTVMPALACKHVYRTGGCKKVANPVFRGMCFVTHVPR